MNATLLSLCRAIGVHVEVSTAPQGRTCQPERITFRSPQRPSSSASPEVVMPCGFQYSVSWSPVSHRRHWVAVGAVGRKLSFSAQLDMEWFQSSSSVVGPYGPLPGNAGSLTSSSTYAGLVGYQCRPNVNLGMATSGSVAAAAAGPALRGRTRAARPPRN